MKPAGAAPWRRLAPLAVLVLAVHAALLQGVPLRLGPVHSQPVLFATRSVAPPPAPVAQPVRAPGPEGEPRPPAGLPRAGLPRAGLRPAGLRPARLQAADLPAADLRLAGLPPARLPAADLRLAGLPPARLRRDLLPPALLPAPPLPAARGPEPRSEAVAAAPIAPPAPRTTPLPAAAPTTPAPSAQAAAPTTPTPSAQAVAPTAPAPPAQAAAPQAAPISLPAVAVPPPARLHYEVTVQKGPFSLTGQALFEWRHDGQHYEARLEASGLAGSRVQRSTGRITPEGLAPSYFSDKARGEQATHFDRANGRLVFSNNRPEAPLAEGTQDRLSVIVQLAALVAGQPAKFPPGTQIAIPTASTREADTWIFEVAGEEDLLLPGGTVRALKLQRLPRRDYEQKVELWLAPRMDYAPVRLRLTNPNGDAVDNRWSSTDKG